MKPHKTRNSTFYIFHNPECASVKTQKNLQIVESGDVTLGGGSSTTSVTLPPALHLSAIPLLCLTHFLVYATEAAIQPSLFPLGWKNSSGMGKGEEWEEEGGGGGGGWKMS